MAATNSVSLTTSSGCSWTINNPNDWIIITSDPSGTGNATIHYILSTNPSLTGRTGVVTVADEIFTVSQPGMTCTVSISPTNRVHGYSPATNSLAVTANPGCLWSVINTNNWIDITSAPSGNGNGTVSYTIDENTTMLQRTGLVMVGEAIFVLSQRPTPCLLELTPTNRVHGSGAEIAIINVTANTNCSWEVENTNTWISILVGSAGTGPGEITYSVDSNAGGPPRNGVLVIGAEQFLVSQQGIGCSFTVLPTNRVHGGGSETGQVSVTTVEGCPWLVQNTNTWIISPPADWAPPDRLSFGSQPQYQSTQRNFHRGG